MLEALISSQTRVKILTLLLLNHHHRYYVREIARKTHRNPNAVRRELANLEGIDLIHASMRGQQKYYQANTRHPIYKELRQMLLKTQGAAKVIRERMDEIGNLTMACIYGSFAKGAEGSGSDIDLLLIGDLDEDALIPLLKKTESFLSRNINYVLMDEEEFKERIKDKDPFIRTVMSGEKIPIIGDPDECTAS